MVAGRKEIDALVAGGCSIPGCDHSSHDEGIFLHGNCHLHAGNEVMYKDGVLYINCAKCQKTVINLYVGEKDD
jgi:hypothetical protein